MTRRPMYRWKSFWLGVVVLCFLGWAWAWVWSFGMISDVRWQWREASGKGGALELHGFALGQVDRRAYLWWDSYDPFQDAGFYHESNPIGPVQGEELPFFIPAILVKDGEVSVAYWFVGLVFLLVWWGWLGWRWRCERRRISV